MRHNIPNRWGYPIDPGHGTHTASTASGNNGVQASGLAPATRYLGSVAYAGASGMPNPTIVRVDTP